jgi:integrative and conjugative element protein (TIGR02256 family)
MLLKLMNTFILSNKGKIKIDEFALTKMLSYKQDESHKLESGGVLLGRFIKDSKNIIIDRITVPMIGDKQERTRFKRNEKTHQRIIDAAWRNTNGTCNYLGEWHTHPENHPSPSKIDKESWKKKLGGDSFSSRYLYFIIIGIKSICVWEGDRRTLNLKEINHE